MHQGQLDSLIPEHGRHRPGIRLTTGRLSVYFKTVWNGSCCKACWRDASIDSFELWRGSWLEYHHDAGCTSISREEGARIGKKVLTLLGLEGRIGQMNCKKHTLRNQQWERQAVYALLLSWIISVCKGSQEVGFTEEGGSSIRTKISKASTYFHKSLILQNSKQPKK